jgi:hypothetical protein
MMDFLILFCFSIGLMGALFLTIPESFFNE